MKREPFDWKTRSSSRSVSHAATVRTADGVESRALVTNLSFEGCELMTERDLEVGQTLVLVLQGRGTIEGQVRWSSDERSGVRFLLGDSPFEQRRVRIGV